MTRPAPTRPAPGSASADATGLRPDYDVVVVGARAAGAATALLLARSGLSVLAVDRAGYGTDTLSTHSLARAGVLQLSRWGLLDAIRDAGTPVARTVVFHYGDDTTRIDVPPTGDIDGLYSPRRTLLDATLVDAAVAAGAEVRHRTPMRAVTRQPSGRVAGVEVEVAGRRQRVGARLVVGADGMRSRVADQVGAEVRHRGVGAAATVYSYWEGLPDHTIVNHHFGDRAVGVIPTNDNAAVVWAGLSAHRFSQVGRGSLAAVHHAQVQRVPELAGHMREGRRVGGYRAFPGAPGLLRQSWGDGWALVGDAGYYKDPLSAHGITDALIGAELLADAIADTVLRGVDEREALERYQLTRDTMAAAMMPPVEAVARLDGDLAAVKGAFRAMSAAMRDEYQLLASRYGAHPLVSAPMDASS